MIRKNVTVNDPSGLHLRPAAKLSETALQFSCRITLEHGSVTANAKSVLSILGACVRCGDTIQLTFDGPYEEEAAEALEALLQEL